MDSKLHKDLTGHENEVILSNLRYISEDPVELWIRLPLIPGINDDSENIEKKTPFYKLMIRIEEHGSV
jgi:pyruvate formate lyase activating enzyme